MSRIIIDKEWCLKMAQEEGDTEIGAGIEENRDFYMREAWELSQEVTKLKEKLEDAVEKIADRDFAIYYLAMGVDFERKMPNETRPTIRDAITAINGSQ